VPATDRDWGYGGPHDPGVDPARRRAEAAGDVASDPIATPSGGWIRVGTASWTDPTMTAAGVFYPSGADTAEERLQFYASQFPLVEVDATYYAIPQRRMAELWRERTPPDFTFDVKAHALLTGQPTETKRLPKPLRDELPTELREKTRIYRKDLPPELDEAVFALFRDGLEPLRESGQLGAVLLQYPRWVFPMSANRDAIIETRERLGLPVAVEFRNASWFNEKNLDRTMRFLGDNGIPFVMVDGPQGFKSSVPAIDAVTSPDLALVRFHGRRTETWEARGVPVVERFRYLYEQKELEDWVPRVARAATTARETHVLMNNCYANYGSTNAREIAKLLADLKFGEAAGDVGAGSDEASAAREPEAATA
jgi:uncharacterized protein YecE (DUF72 family)